MHTSKLTTKYQATIPKEIREKLKIDAGDSVVFLVTKDSEVILKKVRPLDKEYIDALNYTLSEWSTPEDDEAFKHLQDL